MKKLSILILSALLCVFSIVMIGCGSVAGTYKFESLSGSEGGIEINVEAGEEFMGMTITEDFMVLDLKEDGSCVVTMYGETAEGATWVKDGDKVIITAEGEELALTIDGNKLVMTQDGATIVLSK